MELAAVGVSTALFNQVSKITILSLVCVTTSFVTGEDTIRILDFEHEVSNSVEMGSTANGGTKQKNGYQKVLVRDHMIQKCIVVVMARQGLSEEGISYWFQLHQLLVVSLASSKSYFSFLKQNLY